MSQPNASRKGSSWASFGLTFFAVVAAYVLTGRLGMLAAIPPGLVTPIWPPAGIALAAVFLGGPSLALAVALGSITVNFWAASLAGTANTATLIGSVLAIGTGAALQALAGSALIRWTLEKAREREGPLRSARGVTIFVAAASASCLVNATIGTAAVSLLRPETWPGFQTTWWTWWLGDTAGALVCAPVILSLGQPSEIPAKAGTVETLFFSAALFAVGAFGFWGRYPLSYLVAPILVWAAFRFGVRGGSASILAFSIIAIAGAVRGAGPFTGPNLTLNESLLLLQGFMVSSVLTTLLLAAVVEERERAKTSLEQKVEDRTGELNRSLLQMVALQRETEAAKAAAERSGDRAREADRAKSRFLAQMSHELRTPLNAIIGYSELISETLDGTAHADHQEDLSRIRSSAQHLLSLINQLLDLSKIEAGRMELHREAVKTQALLDGLLHTLETLARKNGNRAVVEADPGDDDLETDGMRLKQVLLNMISNACKFTRNGTITLRVRPAGTRDVLFEVEDTGIGMTPAQMERIFEPFAQADSGTYRQYGGTGIGLALCKELARAMGGEITVRCALGKGSVFSLRIPRMMPERMTAPNASFAP